LGSADAAVMTVSAAVAAVFTVTGSVWCFYCLLQPLLGVPWELFFGVVFFKGGGIAYSYGSEFWL